MIQLLFERLAKQLKTTYGVASRWPATSWGVPMVGSSIRHVPAASYTPAGTDIPYGPCDAILLSADATVTLQAADSDAAYAIPLKAGNWIPISCIKITAVSAGAVTLGWYRRPNGS